MWHQDRGNCPRRQRELIRTRIDTPREEHAATLEAIASVVTDLERAAGARATVGLGIPGTLSPDSGLVKNAWLLGHALLECGEAA